MRSGPTWRDNEARVKCTKNRKLLSDTKLGGPKGMKRENLTGAEQSSREGAWPDRDEILRE